MTDEVRLEGGSMTHVVRVGETVRDLQVGSRQRSKLCCFTWNRRESTVLRALWASTIKAARPSRLSTASSDSCGTMTFCRRSAR